MRRTTEQWKALLDGRTEGTWHATDETGGSDILIEETGESLLTVGSVADAWASFATVDDGKLAASAPEAVSELVRIRREIETLHDSCWEEYKALDQRAVSLNNRGHQDTALDVYQQAEDSRKMAGRLTRILEGP